MTPKFSKFRILGFHSSADWAKWMPRMSHDESSHWYCIQTRSKLEAPTGRILRQEPDVEVFCPVLRYQRARSTGKYWAVDAMFPGYFFARFCYLQQYRKVRSTQGVTRIVEFGRQPVIVESGIIEGLRECVAQGDVITVQPEIAPGQPVRIISGPFRGLSTLVTKFLPARQRVAILMEVLGMEREVEISVDAILPDIKHPMTESK